MNILIIDDEKSICELTSLVLKNMGMTVSSAHTKKSGLKLFAEQEFDFILLDLRIGPDCGLEILPSMLEKKPNQLISIITANSSIENAVNAIELGAFDFITKPLRRNKMLDDLTAEVSLLNAKLRDK